MVGVAVNVTDEPLHTVWLAVDIVTEGTSTGLTVIVSEFDVAEVGDAQVAVEVIVQVTI